MDDEEIINVVSVLETIESISEFVSWTRLNDDRSSSHEYDKTFSIGL